MCKGGGTEILKASTILSFQKQKFEYLVALLNWVPFFSFPFFLFNSLFSACFLFLFLEDATEQQPALGCIGPSTERALIFLSHYCRPSAFFFSGLDPLGCTAEAYLAQAFFFRTPSRGFLRPPSSAAAPGGPPERAD